MLHQDELEGRRFQLLKKIYDHRPDQNEIPKRFGLTIYKNGNKTPESMIVDWKLQVEGKYGYMKWLDIKDIMALYPLDLSKYAVTNKINEDP